MVSRDESRGFGYLNDAGRLDLTVAAVVVERFPELFSDEIVIAAKERLLGHGYEPKVELVRQDQELSVGLVPGSTVLIKVSVGGSGELTVRVA